ncbi:hypothetical protein G6F56_003103 [Rhizopus delemar]|uniref:Serum paraoxonase/arylesterase 2 n=1 Tax=Rhizopus stolonifer TaxID=4846 RepID=A0A367JGN4_RHIST|nr:hypothetical protein G6F56_003103 [Rhizopus delemar]RCH89045.1 hypothetical protein CU098_008445 [Rhizopus stolonifer]
MSSASNNYWFHFKYWKLIIPVAVLAPVIWNCVNLSGILNEVEDINVEPCQKMSGPPDFTHCEDFILSDEPGIAYVNCNPSSKYSNKASLTYLNPEGPVENGAIWQVDYSQQPAVLEKFDMGSLVDYHPLGINLDIHPVTGEKTILTVNLAHNNSPSIELFTVQDEQLVHKRTIRHPNIYNPNAVHPLRDEQFRADDGTPSFFFSNDHYFHIPVLKAIEPFLFPLSNVNFYNARTDQVQKVIDRLLFANGVSGSDDILFVSETGRSAIRQYKINKTTDKEGVPSVYLDYASEVKVGGAPDNLNYHPVEQILAIAIHPRPLDLFKRMLADPNDPPNSPSKVVVWDIATDETKVILQDDGSLFSSSTGAAFDFDNSMFLVSGILEEGLLICDL